MKEIESWNILATAKEWQQRRLATLLRPFGTFRWARFLGVLVGQVQDTDAFLEELRRKEEENPGYLDPLARLIPIDQNFDFTLENFAERLKGAAVPYADRIGSGSFYLRIERRGHAGEMNSHQMEQEVGGILYQTLVARGETPRVDFKDPDLIIVAETLDDECGVGAIGRSLRSRFPFIRAP